MMVIYYCAVGEDFRTIDERLVFNLPGNFTLCFLFFPIDDTELEESIVLEATSVTNGEVHFPPGGNQAIIQIIDNGKCFLSQN